MVNIKILLQNFMIGIVENVAKKATYKLSINIGAGAASRY
jgi:hypothetical protein